MLGECIHIRIETKKSKYYRIYLTLRVSSGAAGGRAGRYQRAKKYLAKNETEHSEAIGRCSRPIFSLALGKR